jgi:methylmalonyl-CoA mutase cobalamin-binding domain/chain
MVEQGFDVDSLKRGLIGALLTVNRLEVKKILTTPPPDFSPYELVEKLVVPSLEEIGSGWESGRYSLSQVYMSGRICEEVVDQILPPHHETRRYQPKMGIVVLEDYHLLGKRIVYSILRASGYELHNYGRMNVEEVARRIKQDQIEVLLISVLMLPSALRIKNLRDRLQQQGSKVKIVVGGAPFRFDAELWQEVGADAVGATATEAVEIIDRLSMEHV